MSEGIGFVWKERPDPLTPLGAVAPGAAALTLARRLLQEGEERLSQLQGAGGTAEPVLLILGAAADLPWVDNIIYLGRDKDAPSLLLPTRLAPDVPLPLVERLVLRSNPGLPPPIVYLPETNQVFSATPARPLSRPVLRIWLLAWQKAGTSPAL